MSIYLENYLRLIPPRQRQRIIDALQAEARIAEHSPIDMELVTRLSFDPVMQSAITQPQSMDADIYNENLSHIYVDLSILFNQLQATDVFITNSRVLNASDIQEMREEVYGLRNKVDAVQEYIESGEAIISKIDNFNSKDRIEPYGSLYVDRDGTVVPENHININTAQGVCKLPIESDINALEEAKAKRILRKTITANHEDHKPSMCIDGNPNTLWGETLLIKHPLIIPPSFLDYLEYLRNAEDPSPSADYPGDRLSLAFTLDISGSMRGTAEINMKDATNSLIDMLHPKNMVALTSFNQHVEVVQPFTNNHESVKSAVRNLSIGGWTALYDGMYETIVLTAKEYGVPVIIAVTDGRDNRSSRSANDVISLAKKKNIPIHIIGMGNVNDTELTRIATQTDGSYYYTPTSAGLMDMYQQIAGDLQIGEPPPHPIEEWDLPHADPKWKGLSGGAFSTMEIVFDKPKIINTITLNPLGTKPVEVSNVYIEDDTSGAIDTYFNRVVGIYAPTKPFRINDTHTIEFIPTEAKRIEITLRQPDYVPVHYNIRASAVRDETLWNAIRDKYASEAFGDSWRKEGKYTVEPSVIQDMIHQHTGWFKYIEDYSRRLNEWQEHEHRATISRTEYERELAKWKDEQAKYQEEYSAWLRDPYEPGTGYPDPVMARLVGEGTVYPASRDGWYEHKTYGAIWFAGARTFNSLPSGTPYVRIMHGGKWWTATLEGKPISLLSSISSCTTGSRRLPHSTPRVRRPEPLEPGPPPSPPTIVSYAKPPKEKLISVNMCEYILGLHEAGVKSLAYRTPGIYISKPYQVGGNVIGVELDTVEEHPVFDIIGRATDRQTSIEYYISNVSQPSLSEWIPILPQGISRVRHELLQFDTSLAQLRFKARADMPIKVYKNNQLMHAHEWTINPEYKNVFIKDYIEGHVYTVDYYPNTVEEDPWRVDLLKRGLKPQLVTEEFEYGTDRNGTIKLQHVPYIDREKIVTGVPYNPISVTLYDAEIEGPNDTVFTVVPPQHLAIQNQAYTKNVTDYVSGLSATLNEYHPENQLALEYEQERNEIRFTETFNKTRDRRDVNHGDAKIRVKYHILSANFRLKVIIRNTSEQRESTPILHKYTLKFFTAR